MDAFAKFESHVLLRYRTIRAQSTAEGITRLFKNLREMGIESPSQLDADLVLHFIEFRRAKGVCENTIIGELGRLKAVCGYAVKKKLIDESPFVAGERLLRPEPPKRLSHLTMRELSRLLEQCELEIAEAIELDRASPKSKNDDDPRLTREWQARRLHALIATYIYTGARKNEVLYLWGEDINLSSRMIEISPKRRRLKTPGSDRRVPIITELFEVLEDWLPRTGSQFAFPGVRGKAPWTGGSPGYKPLHKVKGICERAGISGAFIHLFRHSFCTHLEGMGVPAAGAMRITGMTQSKTLSYYTHADEKNLHGFVSNVRFKIAQPA